jgi:hypothetical protein
MKLAKRQLTGREKDEAAVELLENLRDQLHTGNLTVVRQTAFHLSWLQEDGFEILREGLFSKESPRKTKNASSYGLRKMRGRMAKPALEMLKQGAEDTDRSISKICKNALDVFHNKNSKPKRYNRPQRKRGPRFEIRDIPSGNVRTSNRPRRIVRHTAPR